MIENRTLISSCRYINILPNGVGMQGTGQWAGLHRRWACHNNYIININMNLLNINKLNVSNIYVQST